MINAHSSYITLFFDEAETDLWLALQRIEPDERSSFIKLILKQVILEKGIDELLMKEKHDCESNVLFEENSGLNDKGLSTGPEDSLDSIQTFSLENLFEVNVPNQDMGQVVEFELKHSKENQPVRSAGFEYIMKHIIGTEEDEVVLEVLRGFPSKKR